MAPPFIRIRGTIFAGTLLQYPPPFLPLLMISSFDTSLPFFTANPVTKILLSPYLDVPSSHLWAIALYIHPESKLFNESPSSRKSLILKDFLHNDPTFSFEKYAPLIEVFKEKILTKNQRLLSTWEHKLHERDAFIDSLPYNQETYEMLDKLMASTPKMWEQFLKIQSLVEKDKEETTFGDREESLAEQAII